MKTEFPSLGYNGLDARNARKSSCIPKCLPDCSGVEAASAQKGEVSPQMMGTVPRHLSIYPRFKIENIETISKRREGKFSQVTIITHKCKGALWKSPIPPCQLSPPLNLPPRSRMEMWARREVFTAETEKNNKRILRNTRKNHHPAKIAQHDSLISAYSDG